MMGRDGAALSPTTYLLVLCAALLHASWNAILKNGEDRFRSIVLMSSAASLACLPALLRLPVPLRPCWPEVVLSSALHVGYNLFLVGAYRHGDLGQVYPIARGSSPLLVTLGAALVAGEQPGALTAAGIVLVSVGILSLARGWTGASRAGLATALTTGAFIAAYSVTDGIGGRLSGDPIAYSAWLFVVDGVPMVVIFLAVRGRRAPLYDRSRETVMSAIGGLVSVVAYTVIISAASIGPMGPVSALRETSVIFAAVIGWLFLGEQFSALRLGSCALVALGAILLGQQ